MKQHGNIYKQGASYIHTGFHITVTHFEDHKWTEVTFSIYGCQLTTPLFALVSLYVGFGICDLWLLAVVIFGFAVLVFPPATCLVSVLCGKASTCSVQDEQLHYRVKQKEFISNHLPLVLISFSFMSVKC